MTSLIDSTASDAIRIWEEEKSGDEAKTPQPNLLNPTLPAPLRSEYPGVVRWIDVNNCREAFHYFAKDEAGHLQGWHLDDKVCEVLEFNLSQRST